MELTSSRLRLRSWRSDDVAPFAAMCADPCVMRFFDGTLAFDDAEEAVHRYAAREAAAGFCMWAMERVSDGAFLGLAGLQHVPYEAPFTPTVEVGWRLARAHWGHGYASEAACLSLAYGFGPCGLREIVAVATPANTRSLAVMERAGMRRDVEGDFEHPAMREGHPWRRHALYRVQANQAVARKQGLLF